MNDSGGGGLLGNEEAYVDAGASGGSDSSSAKEETSSPPPPLLPLMLWVGGSMLPAMDEPEAGRLLGAVDNLFGLKVQSCMLQRPSFIFGFVA